LHYGVAFACSCRGRDWGFGSGGPGPSSLATEGSGRPVPDTGPPLCSTSEEAGASTSHPGTAGLMVVTLKTPTASSSQMFGTIGTIDNPDVYAECDVALEAGPKARPTQPPYPQWIADVPTGDPVDLELYGSPDTVNTEDILSVDVTPLSSISTSGMDATPCPDMSVAKSVSVDIGTLMSADFDDRIREIPDTATMIEFSTDTTIVGGARRSCGDPSLAPNVGRANLGESPPGTCPLTAKGYTSLGDAASGMIPSMALGRYTDPDDIV